MVDPKTQNMDTGKTLAEAMQTNPKEDFWIGKELRNYRILKTLGEGGMGLVYLAQHTMLGRQSAIKILKPEYCQNQTVVQRFFQEARTVSVLHNENIVEIYDFGLQNQHVFFIMELLDGEPLSDRLERGTIPFQEALLLLEQIVQALSVIHESGVVHRDLKPENIFLQKRDSSDFPEGTPIVKLLDFGIAKLVGVDTGTRTGAILGTPYYMSPEQIQGAEIDHRTDIYSLGVMLYEFWSGERPFVGNTLQQIITGHLLNDPPRLENLDPSLGVPPATASIVSRMLCKEPENRYASVKEVFDDLKRAERGEALHLPLEVKEPVTEETPPQLLETQTKKKPKNRSVFSMQFAIILAVLFGFGTSSILLLLSKKPPTAAMTQTDTKIEIPNPDELREKSRETLKVFLSHLEEKVRVDSVRTIKNTGDKEVLHFAYDKYRSSENKKFLFELIISLGRVLQDSNLPSDPSSDWISNVIKYLEGKKEIEKLKIVSSEALYRLGGKEQTRLEERRTLQRTFLEEACHDDSDLETAFQAALSLASLTELGDEKVLQCVKNLLAETHREELKRITANKHIDLLLHKDLARLGDTDSREFLHHALSSTEETRKLEAARMLAALGDFKAKPILKEFLEDKNRSTKNHLVAGRALLELGDDSGEKEFLKALTIKNPKEFDAKLLSIGALGLLGDSSSIPALFSLCTSSATSDASEKRALGEEDARICVAVVGAILDILGLDLVLLARDAFSGARASLDSTDPEIQRAAAASLGDLPGDGALALLSEIVDGKNVDGKKEIYEKSVRTEAVKSVRKHKKTPKAAEQISKKLSTVVQAETDQDVQIEMIKTLGILDQVVAKDSLTQLSTDQGEIGIYASASIITIQDIEQSLKEQAKERLEKAIEADQPRNIRFAAVEGASYANSYMVYGVLKKALEDVDFETRFTAAEALSRYGVETSKEMALPRLKEGLQEDKSPSMKIRAHAAIIRYREEISETTQAINPEMLLDNTDYNIRLHAIPIIKALVQIGSDDASSLLTRIVTDPNVKIRRKSTEVLSVLNDTTQNETPENGEQKTKQLIFLYKKLYKDSDPICQARAKGQLAQLLPPVDTYMAVANSPVKTTEVDMILTRLKEIEKEAQKTYEHAKEEFQILRTLPIKEFEAFFDQEKNKRLPTDQAKQNTKAQGEKIQKLIETLTTRVTDIIERLTKEEENAKNHLEDIEEQDKELLEGIKFLKKNLQTLDTKLDTMKTDVQKYTNDFVLLPTLLFKECLTDAKASLTRGAFDSTDTTLRNCEIIKNENDTSPSRKELTEFYSLTAQMHEKKGETTMLPKYQKEEYQRALDFFKKMSKVCKQCENATDNIERLNDILRSETQ